MIILFIGLVTNSFAFKTKNCTDTQREIIHRDALVAAQSVKLVNEYLKDATTGSELLKKHFGGKEKSDLTHDAFNMVRFNFYQLSDAIYEDGIKYICTEKVENELAKAVPGFFQRIWIREIYFSGSDIFRAETLVHEWTHEFLWTRDLGYHQKAFEISSQKQLMNAENYCHLASEFMK